MAQKRVTTLTKPSKQTEKIGKLDRVAALDN